MKVIKTANYVKKTAQLIHDDGLSDGGERYTDEEMDLMDNRDKGLDLPNQIEQISIYELDEKYQLSKPTMSELYTKAEHLYPGETESVSLVDVWDDISIGAKQELISMVKNDRGFAEERSLGARGKPHNNDLYDDSPSHRSVRETPEPFGPKHRSPYGGIVGE